MESKCPADGTALARNDVLGRSLQSCPQCGGTFLAAADLTALTRLSARALKLERARTGSLLCPGCGEKLCAASAAGQELQACPNCSGVWLGSGSLRRLMSSGAPEPSRVSPRNRLLVGGALALAGLAGLASFGLGQARVSRLEQQAEAAWQLKDAVALSRTADELAEGDVRKLALARAGYLEQDFVACLDALVGLDSDEARELSKLAESGWMAQVDWPGRVLGSLAVDLDQDTDRELLRLSDPGFGDPGLDLEILARRRRRYGALEIEFRRPDGKPLKKPEVPVALLEARSERVTSHTDGLLFLKLKDGRFALDLVSSQDDKILRYRFVSDTPVKVRDGKIVTSEGSYRYGEDSFKAID